MRRVGLIVLFLLSLGYIFFLTQDIPIFFEGREVIVSQLEEPLTHWIKNIFLPGTTNPFASAGELPGLLMWSLNKVFGYQENAYRFLKGFFFAGTITLIYILARTIIGKIALIPTIILLFSFPIYLQTIIFDELFIYSEFFKLAFLLFLYKDIHKPTSKTTAGILIAGFLSLRFYHPAMAILGILAIIFLTSFRFRYIIFLVILLTAVLPRTISDTAFTFTPNTANIIELFVTGFEKTFNTYPNLIGLYHRPFWDILTPAGILLILLVGFISFTHKIRWTKEAKLLCIWALTEIPIFIFIPEPAIRYVAGIFTPLVLLTFYFFNTSYQQMKTSHKKPTIAILCILVFVIILTNLTYAATFRATWGSGFIAAGKTIEYLQAKNSTLVIGYQPLQVAPDYVPIDTTTEPYSIDKRLQFISYKENNPQDYVLQRITSGGKKYPEETTGTIEKEIVGKTDSLFDTILAPILQGRENTIIIYKN